MSYTTFINGTLNCPNIPTGTIGIGGFLGLDINNNFVKNVNSSSSFTVIHTDTIAENTLGAGINVENKLTTVSNGNIVLAPNGTGDVKILNSGVNDTTTLEDYTGSLGLTKSNLFKIGVSSSDYGYLKYYYNNDTTNSFEIGEESGLASINMTKGGILTMTGTVKMPSIATGPIMPGSFLGIDANGNIVKNTNIGAGVPLSDVITTNAQYIPFSNGVGLIESSDLQYDSGAGKLLLGKASSGITFTDNSNHIINYSANGTLSQLSLYSGITSLGGASIDLFGTNVGGVGNYAYLHSAKFMFQAMDGITNYLTLDSTQLNSIVPYKMSGTTVIDTSRNLINIGTIGLAGTITNTGASANLLFSHNSPHSIFTAASGAASTLSLSGGSDISNGAAITMYNATSLTYPSTMLLNGDTFNFASQNGLTEFVAITSTGLNMSIPIQMGSTTVIDASRNLENINSLSLSSSGVVISNSVTTNSVGITGGTNGTTGATMTLYGQDNDLKPFLVNFTGQKYSFNSSNNLTNYMSISSGGLEFINDSPNYITSTADGTTTALIISGGSAYNTGASIVMTNANNIVSPSIMNFYGTTYNFNSQTGVGTKFMEITGSACTNITGVWATFSTREVKENIVNLESVIDTEILYKMQPVAYNYKYHKLMSSWGFIAEDITALGSPILDTLVIYDCYESKKNEKGEPVACGKVNLEYTTLGKEYTFSNGKKIVIAPGMQDTVENTLIWKEQGLSYDEIIPLLVAAAKKEKARANDMEKKYNDLAAEVKKIRQDLETLIKMTPKYF